MDGSERPIASRTLTKTERQYAQIEEALELYRGTRKFQCYLEGRPFTLVTDHKPLQYIMAPSKAVPSTAAARLQRWCVFLGAFTYKTEHRGTRQHCTATVNFVYRCPEVILRSQMRKHYSMQILCNVCQPQMPKYVALCVKIQYCPLL